MSLEKIKEIKQLSSTNKYVGAPIGCDAENVDMADGSNLEETIEELKKSVPTITVDTDLSTTSTNPVQNKVITSNLTALNAKIGAKVVITNDDTTPPDDHSVLWVHG